jgi:hypothetical protein
LGTRKLTSGTGDVLERSRQADDGLRTRDLQLGKLALYQLSYVRVGGYSSTLGVALVT